MTGPVDVAYVEIEPRFTGFADRVKTELDEAFRGVDNRGGGFEAAGANAGRQFAEGFKRDANGRLRDARGFSGFGDGGADGARAATGAFSAFTNVLRAGISGLAAFSSSIGTTWTVILTGLPVIISVAAALSSLLGLLAAVPAGFAVAGALIAPLVIGFSGFTDALQETSSAGGAAVDTMGQIEDAEYRLAQAQRTRKRATDDIARATRDATRQLQDLNEAVSDGARDETSAQLAVEAARRRIRGLRGLERREAQQDYLDAVDRLDDIRRENSRNAEDLAEAQKKGVQGADQVVAAREAEADAIHAVAEAQKALARAQQGSGGGGGGVDKQAEALAALAPAARSVAEEIIGLKPRFEEFRRNIQQALFEPLIGDATKFTETTLPHIEAGMVKVAGTIGEKISGFLDKLSTPRAGEFFDKVFASADKIITLVGPGVEKLFTAIARGVEAGLPFIERFAGGLGEGLEKFADFITEAIEDGRFEKWIEDGIRIFDELKEITKDAGALIKELFTEENIENGLIFLMGIEGIIEAVTSLVGWYNDLLDSVEKVGENVHDFFADIPKQAKQLGDDFRNAGKFLIRHFFQGLQDVGGFINRLADRVGGAIKGVLNDVIGGINWSIASIDDVLPFSLPRIPALASGGLATGATLAMIGEGRHDEAVIPLGDARAMSAIASAVGNNGNQGPSIVFGPGSIVVGFDGSVPTESEARRTGNAVGRGILDQLAARNIRTAVRAI